MKCPAYTSVSCYVVALLLVCLVTATLGVDHNQASPVKPVSHDTSRPILVGYHQRIPVFVTGSKLTEAQIISGSESAAVTATASGHKTRGLRARLSSLAKKIRSKLGKGNQDKDYFTSSGSGSSFGSFLASFLTDDGFGGSSGPYSSSPSHSSYSQYSISPSSLNGNPSSYNSRPSRPLHGGSSYGNSGQTPGMSTFNVPGMGTVYFSSSDGSSPSNSQMQSILQQLMGGDGQGSLGNDFGSGSGSHPGSGSRPNSGSRPGSVSYSSGGSSGFPFGSFSGSSGGSSFGGFPFASFSPPAVEPPPPELNQGCGMQASEFQPAMHDGYERIVNGFTANKHSWPWQVLVHIEDKFMCGGAVISPTVVVTAAHCFNGKSTIRATVYAAAHHKFGQGDREAMTIEARGIAHQMYDPSTNANDIALMVLSRPLPYNKYIQPICLPTQGEEPPLNAECMISGWGTTNFKGKTAEELQEARINIRDQQYCYRALGPKVQSMMLCAGGDIVDTCQGDSGGPLACKVNGRWTLYGVTSFGIGCGQQGFPGVYARVPLFINWINSQMNSLRN